MHFCSSLTRADFRKSAWPGPRWVGIALLVLMGTLPLPPTGQRPPASSLQLCPHPHPLHLLAQILWIHLCFYPHILPFLTPAVLTPSPFLPHHHRPQLHSRSTTCHRTLKEIHASHTIPDFCNGTPAFFPSSSGAELIAFLSGNHYDLILLQETHLSSTKKFQIPGYYTLCTDRTFGRQGPVSSGTHNTGGGVLTLIHSDLAFSPVSVSSLSSQDPYSDYNCVKVLLSNHSPLQFLYLYSPPIRNSPSDSRTRTFYPDILPNSPDTFILGDFNAHYPTWDRLIPPNPLGNDLFRWITSSGLEILNDPASPTLLHHSTGSRSSPDILLAPASLAPHCEWRTLHGLGSDHLPIEIVLPFFPVRQPNTRPPKFNYKITSWDIYQSYIAEHLPCLDFDALNMHQAAHSSSLFLVEAAKASIPFG